MDDFFVVEPCKSSNAFEIKLKDKKLDLKRCEIAIPQFGKVIASGPVVLLAKTDEYSISIYASGRIMVKGKKLESKKIDALARKILGIFETCGAIL